MLEPEAFPIIKPQACLPDMPLNVMDHIFKSIGFKDRTSMKQVSKAFYNFENKTAIHYEVLFLELTETMIDLRLQYGEDDKDVGLKYGLDDIQNATLALFRLLKNKKATFGTFGFGWLEKDTPDTDEVQKQKRDMLNAILQNFRQLGHKIKAKGFMPLMNLKVSQIEEFLPFLKTEALNFIGVRLSEETSFDQMTESPLWQQIDNVYIVYADDIPLRKFHNMVDGCLVGSKATVDDLKAMTQAFLQNAKNFKTFEIHELVDFKHSEFKTYVQSLSDTEIAFGHRCVLRTHDGAYLAITLRATSVFFKKSENRRPVRVDRHPLQKSFREGRHLL